MAGEALLGLCCCAPMGRGDLSWMFAGGCARRGSVEDATEWLTYAVEEGSVNLRWFSEGSFRDWRKGAASLGKGRLLQAVAMLLALLKPTNPGYRLGGLFSKTRSWPALPTLRRPPETENGTSMMESGTI